MSKYPKAFIILVLLLMLKTFSNVDAFIRREYTLEEIVNACSNVLFGKVSLVDQEKMCFIVDRIENIKGEEQFKQITISVAIGQGDCSKQLMDKLRADVPIVIFYAQYGPKRIESIGYVSGMWIRLFAIHDNPEYFEWYFTYFEKYMSRTFDGDTMELQSSIREMFPDKKLPNSSDNEGKGLRAMLKNLVDFVVRWFDGKDGKGARG